MLLFLGELWGRWAEEWGAQHCCHVLTRILTSKEVRSVGCGKKMRHCFSERMSWHLCGMADCSKAHIALALKSSWKEATSTRGPGGRLTSQTQQSTQPDSSSLWRSCVGSVGQRQLEHLAAIESRITTNLSFPLPVKLSWIRQPQSDKIKALTTIPHKIYKQHVEVLTKADH